MPELNVSTSSCGNGDFRGSELAGVNLYFHAYSYFPYEKELARREVIRVAGVPKVAETASCFRLPSAVETTKLRTLTYVAEIASSESRFSTFQHELEESHRRVAGLGKRQATRYSVHGLHEYKGRFNPQIVRFLLNYLGADERTKVLDPFCGSGTTLVEAAIHGVLAVGLDMNPLAVFLSNAKLRALATPACEIASALQAVLKPLRKFRATRFATDTDTRISYLANWFPAETVALLEALRASIREHGGRAEPVLLSLASDLLRDYSLQEPADLRIRRRISPFPSEPLLNALENKTAEFVRNLTAAQEVTGLIQLDSEAVVEDSRDLAAAIQRKSLVSRYDLVITSPPYATALPYIDTQRLSLVWLGLCSAEEIRRLEGEAVGSREVRYKSSNWDQRLRDNTDELPARLASFCRKLKAALGSKDGFRRQAVPSVVYRYFADMRRVFLSLSNVLSGDAKLAFVVGPNRTTLGGQRFVIDTPRQLGLIAEDLGFRVSEVIPLQTYQRYGLHQNNSIQSENLTILER
jgi:site-specific DNA-methyltransferase (cytosine-N4-specific)